MVNLDRLSTMRDGSIDPIRGDCDYGLFSSAVVNDLGTEALTRLEGIATSRGFLKAASLF